MDSDQAKLFIGGISWETNEETLRYHFGKYGEVVGTVIMRDRNTGSKRGFGFVSFSELSAADKALQEKHDILGRTVEVKKAVPRCEHQQQNKGFSKNHSRTNYCNNNVNSQLRTKKIFVGGLAPTLKQEEFKSYFEKFGQITDVVVMYDSVTRRPRGFGFIAFDSEEAVETVMQKSFHELNDRLVEVKKAIPRDGGDGNNVNGNNNGHWARTNNGARGSVYGSYGGGIYPVYDPRYGFYQGYGWPPPVLGYGNMGGYPYGGGGYTGPYPIGVYGGFCYGTHLGPARTPWDGQGMAGTRRSPTPYASPAIYPQYANAGVGIGGYVGITPRGPAINDKSNQGGGNMLTQAGGNPDTTAARAEGGELADDSSCCSGINDYAPGKKSQLGDDPDNAS